MPKRYETSDGRYVKVSATEWWDTTGTDILREALVDKYLADNPDVGVVVLEVEDWLGELPDDGGSPHVH